MRARHSPPAPGMFIRCRARGWRLRWRPLRVLARHGGTDAIGPRCWLGCQPIQLPNRREHAAASAARTRAREAKPALSSAAPSSMRDGCDLAQGGERPWPRRPVPAEQTSECAQRAGGMRKVWCRCGGAANGNGGRTSDQMTAAAVEEGYLRRDWLLLPAFTAKRLLSCAAQHQGHGAHLKIISSGPRAGIAI